MWEFTAEENYQKEFYNGSIPGFQQGVHLEVEEDDGTKAFEKEHARIEARESTLASIRG